MNKNLIQLAGKFYFGDETLIQGEEISKFWCLICVRYLTNSQNDSLVCYAKKIGVEQVTLFHSWIEKLAEEQLRKIVLIDEETGELFICSKQSLEGYYYLSVYCKAKDILTEYIEKRINDFRYFYFTLRKQGWEMSPRFVNSILNEGIFLTREKDPTKRVPYDFMQKLNIRMG
ncbi:hypothetical protein GHK79_11870 [Enterococcus faecium]|uniref:hypothetical protein n=1 Tax=Enterococcus faecium TaxID=1352 RepID=UPI0019232F52|nr:hypothetical protein [Enterococcus faecium]EHK9937325.1 hypothetical protein [Enterococcus faecium]EME3581663.1 hypothetical protein [Enterococcus faecium]EMF0114609.1 hypothetical protein [Enterococcus hirae]MBL3708507.1 hypothetical protein [Enterococcus faecium]